MAVPLASSCSSHRARVDAIVSIQLAIMRHTRTATLLLVCLSASTVSGKATPKEDATDVPPAQQFDDDILATFAPFESVCVTRTQTEYHVEYHHIDLYIMGHLIKD